MLSYSQLAFLPFVDLHSDGADGSGARRQLSILSIYFSKRDTDNADDLRSVPRISLPQFILELYLSESSLKSDCDLRIMDLIGGSIRHSLCVFGLCIGSAAEHLLCTIWS
eukprot:2663088-Rhodomonas_salina.11